MNIKKECKIVNKKQKDLNAFLFWEARLIFQYNMLVLLLRDRKIQEITKTLSGWVRKYASEGIL